MKLLERLLPSHRNKQDELIQASRSVSLTISRYRDMSRELQEEIERNRFAKYFVYEKGDRL